MDLVSAVTEFFQGLKEIQPFGGERESNQTVRCGGESSTGRAAWELQGQQETEQRRDGFDLFRNADLTRKERIA